MGSTNGTVDRRLLLYISTGARYTRDMLSGAVEQCSLRREYILRLLQHPSLEHMGRWRKWPPAGILANLHNREMAEAFRAINAPLINVSDWHYEEEVPRFGVDDRAVGRMAADYLLGKGVHNLAFVGADNAEPSLRRQAGFRDAIGSRRIGYHEHAIWGTGVRPMLGQTRDWLRSLPTPIGIFAFSDQAAICLAEEAVLAGFKIPDDGLLLAAQNDDILDQMANPSLSSIELPGREIGRRAAEALLAWIDKGEPPAPVTELPPVRVVERISTERSAVEDADVSKAVSFIQEHVHQGINVDDVLQVVGVSRRTLEKRFKSALGMTPLEEIQRLRVARAKDLLSRSDFSLNEVAVNSGFSSVSRLCIVFKQQTGRTPAQFRRESR